MSVIINPSHTVTFSTIRVGSEFIAPDPIQVTQDQYNVLKDALVNDKFVELNGSLYNSNTIKTVEKLPEKKTKLPERWQFDSDREYDAAMAEYKGS